MRPGLSEEIWRVARVLFIASLLGWSMDLYFQFFLLGLFIYFIWSFRKITKIFAWVDGGMRSIPPGGNGIWGDITEILNRQRKRHRKAKDKLSSAIRRVTQIVESIDDGIVILNQDRTIDSWNQAATKFLGVRKSDRGISIFNLIRDPDFVAYLSSSETLEPVQVNLPNNIERTLQISASMVGDKDIVLVITDITKFSNIDRLKSEFVSNVSHELRTPLTVFRGYLESLDGKGKKSSAESLAMQQMLEQVNRMEVLANDLSILSAMEETDSAVHIETFNLRVLIEELVVESKKLGNSKHVFSLELSECQIIGDLKGMRAAFGNIISNAVLHNPEGVSVEITLTVESEGVLIIVRDNGIGLALDDIPRLTERFFRGDKSRNFATGGSGLGLAIAKHAINRSGGRLDISGNVGEGAKFSVWLPYREGF